MAWLKVFAHYIKTASRTEDELHERTLNRVCAEREPEHREQRVLETRSWRDPSKMTCQKPDGR